MILTKKVSTLLFSTLVVTLIFCSAAMAQNKTGASVITDAGELKKLVPTSFYFAGQSAPTQMRNAAAAKFGDHYVIVGMVDTSGYSTEISGKYEGFFITDAPVRVGDKDLDTGAYGFGFSKEGKINIFDLSSKELLSAATTNDAAMKRPRPLMMAKDENGIRLYKGKDYVVVSAK